MVILSGNVHKLSPNIDCPESPGVENFTVKLNHSSHCKPSIYWIASPSKLLCFFLRLLRILSNSLFSQSPNPDIHNEARSAILGLCLNCICWSYSAPEARPVEHGIRWSAVWRLQQHSVHQDGYHSRLHPNCNSHPYCLLPTADMSNQDGYSHFVNGGRVLYS